MIGIVSADPVFRRMLQLTLGERPVVFSPDADCALCLWDTDSAGMPDAPLPGLVLLARTAPDSLPAGARFLRRPFPLSGLRRLVDELSPEAAGRDTRLIFSDGTHSVTADGRTVPLSAAEYRLLRLLAVADGGTVSRAEAAALFGHSGSNVVDVYISYLRKKLAALPGGGRIVSVRGQGYAYKQGELT